MPQIGWLEILAIVIIAILVLGPKEFPIALKKIGSYVGKLKNTLSSFQREVSSVTNDLDIEKDIEKELAYILNKVIWLFFHFYIIQEQ
jgi:sec-independent protein translocase protein TatB